MYAGGRNRPAQIAAQFNGVAVCCQNFIAGAQNFGQTGKTPDASLFGAALYFTPPKFFLCRVPESNWARLPLQGSAPPLS